MNERPLHSGYPPILEIAAAVASLLAVLAAMYFYFSEPPEDVRQVTVTLMPENSSELLRHQHPGPDGVIQVHIKYRNGDTGLQILNPDQSVSQFSVMFKDGGYRMRASYSQDGRLLMEGFRLRDDHSLWWETTTLESGVIRTLVYWSDGTSVFADESRLVDRDYLLTQYYHQNGKPWVKQLQVAWDPSNILEEEARNANGELLYTRTRNAANVIVVHYGQGAIPKFKQTWLWYTDPVLAAGDEFGGGGSDATSLVKSKIEEFEADGVTVKRRLEFSPDGKDIVRLISIVRGVETQVSSPPVDAGMAALTIAIPNSVQPNALWNRIESEQ
jgi:hypothetical protein